jgi:hypothetical protein
MKALVDVEEADWNGVHGRGLMRFAPWREQTSLVPIQEDSNRSAVGPTGFVTSEAGFVPSPLQVLSRLACSAL